ncbi:hypothetical protein BDV32DRAFT_124061 [Aspergillus pseudonomiae]|nr:hypothetical protein BDV32DRAFT_124061 [Aspergillus pseudonomiae]
MMMIALSLIMLSRSYGEGFRVNRTLMCLPQMNSLSSTILSPVFRVRLSLEEQWRDFGTIIGETAQVWTEMACQYLRRSAGYQHVEAHSSLQKKLVSYIRVKQRCNNQSDMIDFLSLFLFL